MIWEAADLEIEEELVGVPKNLGNGGQATVDELKELSLKTNEDPRAIFVSTMLTPVEEKQYFHLLSKYRDVLARSYRKRPDLDPKVTIHNFAIRKGVSPKKQPQRCFHP